MRTHYGHTNVQAVVGTYKLVPELRFDIVTALSGLIDYLVIITCNSGLLVFTHTWFWFPLSHFIALAYQPTCLIGLNKNLDVSYLQRSTGL